MKKKIFIYQAIDSKGGSKQSLFNFIKLLNNDVDFIGVFGVNGWFYKEVKEYCEKCYLIEEHKSISKSITIKNKFIFNLWKLLRIIIFGWGNVWKNFNIIKKEKIDLVILNENRDLLFVGIPAILLRKKVYSFIRGEINKKDLIRIVLSDKVIALSKYLLKNNSKLRSSKKIVVIPNYIKKQGNERSISVYKEDLFQIAFAGSLIPVKGLEHLIKIITNIKEYNIVVNIYGDFPRIHYKNYKEKIYNAIENNLISDIVVFHGWVDDLNNQLVKNDILISTSNSEGLPRVVLEAMSNGLPIIAFNVGGIRDLVVNNLNGFIIEHGDYSSFSKKIIKLINNKELKKSMGDESKKIVHNYFSEEVVRNKFLKLIYS